MDLMHSQFDKEGYFWERESYVSINEIVPEK
jgi:hypothetical protein